jgi:branched-chain amino acid transport system ATP-binding protein
VNALVVRGLTQSFGALQAVAGVDLGISPGERRALIGPNGAGKTTVFNLVSGTLAPTSGRIELFGESIGHLPPHRRARRGLARTFQITTLFANLTVLDNVLLAVQALDHVAFAMHRPQRSYRHLVARAEELLARWGLADRASQPVRTLSYGEQRQVELILALAGTPRLLLLDEPMAGLSPAERAIVAGIIRGLGREISMLLIEHDMDVALDLADRVTVLHQGRILAEGAPDAIRRNPEVLQIYLGED